MKLSVVMATYNGGKYIKRQLESIFCQSRKADEVLIFDDGSTDDTCRIVKDYISEHHIEDNWKLYINNSNKGVVLNFLDGAEEASGEIIFYADQDDIWDEHKIEMMEKGFLEYPDMLACYCLRHFINSDEISIPLKYDFMSNVRVKTEGFQKVSVSEAVCFNKSPGLCLAIKKTLISETRDMILDNHLTHDLPIGTVAAIHDGYYVLNQRLVYYRQHGSNVSSARYSVASRLTGIEIQIKGRQLRVDQMRAIYNNYESMMTDEDRINLSNAITKTERSIVYLKNRKIGKLFFELFDTNPMLNKWIAVNNLLISLRRNT